MKGEASRPEQKIGDDIEDDFAGDEPELVAVLLRLGCASTLRGASAARESRAALIGRRIAEFEVLELLGAGGMGCVYRARDTVLGRSVALKILPAQYALDDARRRLLLREAQSAAILGHSGIAAVYALGEADGIRFIVMEYVRGPTLRALIREGDLTPSATLRYGLQLSRALGHAHRKGVIHRDFKPDNVMIATSDGEGSAKILDFGLAKLLARPEAEEHKAALADTSEPEKSAITVGDGAGTPGYMSPEQAARGRVDARTDIYAFGVVLREMLRSCAPDAASADLRDGLEAIAERCTGEAPISRFTDGGELTAALEALSPAPSLSEVARRPRPWSSRGAAALLGIAAAPVAAGAIAFLGRSAPSGSPAPPALGSETLWTAPLPSMVAVEPPPTKPAASPPSDLSREPKRAASRVAPPRSRSRREAGEEPAYEPLPY